MWRNRLSALVLAGALGACGSTGGIGDVLGGVLNSPSNQFDGTIESVDTRAQNVYVRQSNGQSVAIGYDNRTEVVYQNQNYNVSALERGDRVTVRFIDNGNNTYYTDLITVTESVQSSGGVSNNGSVRTNTVYALQGNVRGIDFNAGSFRVDTQDYGSVLVTVPYNASSTDVSRFRNLRNGDWVNFYGVFTNQNGTRATLREFR